MNWKLAPALLAAAVMTLFGISAAVKPSALSLVGVVADSPLGSSEIRAVFGGMFIALGLACILTREPLVFAIVGAAWLVDFAVRLVAVFVDHVPADQALVVLAIAVVMGVALLSGYWVGGGGGPRPTSPGR